MNTMDSLSSSLISIESKSPLLLITLLTLITLVTGYLYSNLKYLLQFGGKKLPQGSFGFPVIGESISFLSACKQDKVDEWLQKHVDKYGPFFKTSLFGSKVVVLTGQAGSRLVFQGGDNGVSYKQPKTIANIIGKNNLFELSGDRHKLIRGAIVGFFRPENIQKFVCQIDSRVEKELLKELNGKDSVKIMNAMKKIAFSVTWSIFFGFPDGIKKDKVLEDFNILLKGMKAIPVNLPGTGYNKGIKARARLRNMFSELVGKRRQEIEQGRVLDTNANFLSALVNLRDENGQLLAEEVILDNMLTLISASHDTVAVLTTLFIRHLSRDTQAYNKVLQEQMEVMKAKGDRNDGGMNLKEIQMMKYSWRVAQEVMRIRSPIPSMFRQATRDILLEGFHIPKGWQLLFFSSGTHMDKNIFQDPKEFDPSRFENSNKSYPPYTYVAFGAGPRICPGAEFGKIEAMLIVHHFITKYEWKEMIPDEPITLNPIPYPAMGFPVTFHLKNM